MVRRASSIDSICAHGRWTHLNQKQAWPLDAFVAPFTPFLAGMLHEAWVLLPDSEKSPTCGRPFGSVSPGFQLQSFHGESAPSAAFRERGNVIAPCASAPATSADARAAARIMTPRLEAVPTSLYGERPTKHAATRYEGTITVRRGGTWPAPRDYPTKILTALESNQINF